MAENRHPTDQHADTDLIYWPGQVLSCFPMLGGQTAVRHFLHTSQPFFDSCLTNWSREAGVLPLEEPWPCRTFLWLGVEPAMDVPAWRASPSDRCPYLPLVWPLAPLCAFRPCDVGDNLRLPSSWLRPLSNWAAARLRLRVLTAGGCLGGRDWCVCCDAPRSRALACVLGSAPRRAAASACLRERVVAAGGAVDIGTELGPEWWLLWADLCLLDDMGGGRERANASISASVFRRK